MRARKTVLVPQRLRSVPGQFSWVDHALVQRHLIDRCDALAAKLYLFLVTVADARGLSYYGEGTLSARLRCSHSDLAAARRQLVELDLVAYRAPLYQVLSLSDGAPAPPADGSTSVSSKDARRSDGPIGLAELMQQLERHRDGL
jgi:hypothetical protein